MNHSVLKAQLEELEKKWFWQLQGLFPNIPPHLQSIANGYAQFFSIEHLSKDAPRDKDFPVIVAVGINYDQGPPHTTSPVLRHWLSSHLPPSRTFGTNWVEDPPPWEPPSMWPSDTRNILDSNLAMYFLNESHWKTNGFASDTGLLSQFKGVSKGQPYILVFTNLSPFLTQECWTDHRAEPAKELLNAWNPNNHLCELMHKLGNRVDLWVVHGKGEVWPRFQPCCGRISNWILTENLNPQNKGRITTFWQKPKPTAKHPIWPCCPSVPALGKSNVL